MATNYIIEKVTGTDSSSNRIASTFYCTCATAAATAQKDATVSDSCTFNDNYLITGVTVHVKFTNSNTHATPTLKVGTATAKQIMKYGTTKPGTTAATSWQAGSVVSLTYDGTYWQMNDHLDDTNTQTVTGVKGDSESSYRTGNVNLTAANVGALASSTLYAGASTAGGAATSAAKLTNTSKIGDTNKPVYFTANGVPSAISYTIDKSVPSDAVFTDSKVAQASGASNDADYKLIFEEDSTSGSVTGGTRKSQYIVFNPSSCTLKITGNTPSGGYLNVANITSSHINGVDVTANPKFTDQAVQQLMGTASNADYKVLYEDDSSSSATNTSGSRKATTFKYNPYFDKLTVGSISVSTPTYTLTKTSGTWTVGTVTAKRCGNVVHMKVTVKGTGTAVAGGSDGFIGTITAGSGGALPALTITLTSYVQNFVICGYIDTSGKIWVRPIGSGNLTVANGTSIEIDGTFICA